MQFLLFLASSALLVNGNKEMSFASMSPHTKFYFHIWAEALSLLRPLVTFHRSVSSKLLRKAKSDLFLIRPIADH